MKAKKIKTMGEMGIDKIHKLCVMIWHYGEWSKERSQLNAVTTHLSSVTNNKHIKAFLAPIDIR